MGQNSCGSGYFFLRVDRLSSWLGRRRRVGRKKVTSIWLKIGQRIAYGQGVIATRGFRACQNSYGFRAIWSWQILSSKFSILRDLLRNLIFGKKNFVVFFRARSLPNSKIDLVQLKAYLYTFIWAFSIFWVKTLMGLELFEAHFWHFFSTDQKVSSNWLEISYKVLSRTSAGKNMNNLPTSFREKLFYFSRKDVSRKKYFT